MRAVARQPICQRDRRGFGAFGGLAVDDHQQRVAQLRKRGVDRALVLAPVDIGRDQFGGVGGHREMARRIDDRPDDQREAQCQHDEGSADAGGDQLENSVGDHFVAGASGPLKYRNLRRIVCGWPS